MDKQIQHICRTGSNFQHWFPVPSWRRTSHQSVIGRRPLHRHVSVCVGIFIRHVRNLFPMQRLKKTQLLLARWRFILTLGTPTNLTNFVCVLYRVSQKPPHILLNRMNLEHISYLMTRLHVYSIIKHETDSWGKNLVILRARRGALPQDNFKS